jgi:glycosyltransferase involved in cell wall biosynthesis
VVNLLLTMAAHPLRAGRVLATVALRSAPRNAIPQLAAACTGLAWARRPEVTGASLHAHFGWVSATMAWAAASAASVPYTVVLHAFEVHDARYHDRFTRTPLEAAQTVFVISGRDVDLVAARWGVRPALLRMGVPASWPVPDVTPPREPPVLVAVGSLVPKKGHDVLLTALPMCATRYRLVILGEGPEGPRLLALRAELGLEDRVELAGFVDEPTVRAHLGNAWAAVLAALPTARGDQDGVPVALIEAMACGIPVVSTDAGAIPELVEGAGIIVPAGDAKALAMGLDELADPRRRAEVAQRGLDRVRSDWTVDRWAAVVLEAHAPAVD